MEDRVVKMVTRSFGAKFKKNMSENVFMLNSDKIYVPLWWKWLRVPVAAIGVAERHMTT